MNNEQNADEFNKEDRFRVTLDSAPTAMVMVDDTGKIVLVNAEAEKLFGYSRDAMVGQSVELLIPKRFQSAHSIHRRKFFDKPETRRMGAGRELYGVRKNGTEFPIEIGLNPVRFDQKVFVLSTIVDITERREFEAAQERLNQTLRTRSAELEKAEERFRVTLDSAPTAMVMVNKVGNIVLVNVETEKLFGYSRTDMIDQPLEKLIPSRYQKYHPGHRSQFFEAPETRRMGAGRELFAQRSDGTEFPVEIGLNPVEIDGEIFVLSAIVDITARRELEKEQQQLNLDLKNRSEQLARAEERFRTVFDGAPSSEIVVNSLGKIVLVNRETERLFGYQRSELLDQPIETLLPEKFRMGHSRFLKEYFKEPKRRKMGVGRDLLAVRKDGSEFPVEIGLNPVEIDGELLVLSVINDISERKQLENAQKQYQSELENRVSERTQELAKSNDALEQSNIELRHYAYVASHDLQSPLRGIAGFARMLQEEYSQKLDEEANNYIDRIIKGATRLQSLIRELLTYSRVDSETTQLQAVDMNQIYDDVLLLLNESIYEANGQVSRDTLPVVNGDASQLAQLLQNLIDNGIKYCSSESPKVHLSVKKKDDHWLFSVKDNGIGIDQDNYDRIFEIFKRLHTQKEYPGTGIGLALCRRIVRRHGGEIWLESENNKGTTFYFTLEPAAIDLSDLDSESE